jgi:hypothetical protein
VALAVPAVAVGAGKLWCQINIAPRPHLSDLSPLMAMYSDADAAMALGKRYLRQADSTALGALERLQATELLQHAIATGCPIKTMSAVQQACRDDFRAGRIHCIDGWVLAQTELDIAALFTIS